MGCIVLSAMLYCFNCILICILYCIFYMLILHCIGGHKVSERRNINDLNSINKIFTIKTTVLPCSTLQC